MGKLKLATKEIHDINQLPADGYLVFALSMSRLSNAQNAEECYKALEFFENKITKLGLDVIFLYTNGLYYNNNDSALEVRKKTNGQMIAHSNSIRNIIVKKRKYLPQAMHFLPWDYVILNCPEYQEYYEKLKKLDKEDSEFHKLLLEALKEREESEANLNFLIEEIAVTHVIRQKSIEFPKTLVKKDNYRLIIYPGPPLKADIYQWSKKVLPQNKDFDFYDTHYDFSKKVAYHFDEL